MRAILLPTLLTSLLSLVLASHAVAEPQGVRWQNDLESAMRLASQTHRLVLVHFWAPWCKPCMQLERNVFNQAGLARSLEMRYIPVKVNTDQFPAIARRYGVANVPTDVVLSADGRMVARVNSPPNWQAYAKQMAQIASRQSPVADNRAMALDRTTRADRRGPSQRPVAWPGSQPTGTGTPYPSADLPGATANAGSPNRRTPPPANHPYGPISQSFASPVTSPTVGTPGRVPYGRQAGADRPYPMATGSQPAYAAPNSASCATTQPLGNYRSPLRNAPVAGGYGSPAVGQAATSRPPANAPVGLANRPATSSQPIGQRPTSSSQPPRWSTPAQTPRTSQAGPGSGGPPPSGQPAVPAFSQATASPRQPIGSRAAAASKPGQPSLGLDGYCPVTLRTKQQWVPGDRRWGAIHRGRTYLFATRAAQQQFLADPDEFSPVLSGLDPVAIVDAHQAIAGQRRHGVFYGGRVYLFSSEASLHQFSGDPERYVQGVRQAMRTDASAIGRR